MATQNTQRIVEQFNNRDTVENQWTGALRDRENPRNEQQPTEQEAAAAQAEAEKKKAEGKKITVTGATTGADKFNVKITDDNGNVSTSVMTRAELKDKGVGIPEKIDTQSKIGQDLKAGMTEEQTYNKYYAEKEAAKWGGMDVKEAEKSVRSDNQKEMFSNFRKKYSFTADSAQDIINKYKENPDDKAFDRYRDDRYFMRDLGMMAEGKWDFIPENIAWGKLNDANKKNPEILKTINEKGKQWNVLNLEEAAKAGLDAETLNLTGRTGVDTIIKANKYDAGTYSRGGYGGITQNFLNTLPGSTEKYEKAKKADEAAKQLEEFNSAEQAKYDNATPEGKFKILQDKGVIPKGAKFISIDADGGIRYSEPASQELLSAQETIIKLNKQSDPQQKAAMDTLAYWRNKDGSYRVEDALISGTLKKTNKEQLAIIDAVETLFGDNKDIQQLKKDSPWLFKAGDTPSKSENIVTKSFREGNAMVPAGLVGAAGFTQKTPFKQDDMLLAGIVAAVSAGYGVSKLIKNIREGKVKSSEAQIVIIDAANKAQLLDPREFLPPGGIYIDNAELTYNPGEEIKPDNLKPIKTEYPVFRDPTTGEQLIPANIKTVILLPTPGMKRTAEESYLLASRAALETAEKKLISSLPDKIEVDGKTLTKSDVQKAIEEANDIIVDSIYNQDQKDMMDYNPGAKGGILKGQSINTVLRQLPDYETSHNEYLRKLKIWQAAWQSYIKSVNPSPVKGSLTPVLKVALATALLKQRMAKVHFKSGQIGEEAISRDIDRALKGITEKDQSVKATLLRILKTANYTNTKPSVKTSSKVKTQTQTQTKTQTKTQAKTDVKQAVNQAVAETTAESTRTAVKTLEATTETTKTKKEFELSGKSKDKANRQAILNAKYSVGYKLGELKGKPVWHTFISNGGQWQRVMVIGKAPDGVKVTSSGAQSAYRTIQNLTRAKGIPAGSIREDVGAFTSTINTGKGRPGLKFARDNSSSYSSDRLPTSKGMPHISGKFPRISKPVPRITPPPPVIHHTKWPLKWPI